MDINLLVHSIFDVTVMLNRLISLCSLQSYYYYIKKYDNKTRLNGISFYFSAGDGIKCWVCRSLEDPKCADPFDNTSTPFTDCSTFQEDSSYPVKPSTMCRKLRQKINGEWRYIRSCARLGEPGIGGDERYCLQRTGSFNIHVESCTCNSRDGCNSGNLPQSMSLTLLATFSFMGSYIF